MIYLGTYKSGEKDQIHVDLKLDKNVGLEYCDLLTKNDWKFMVTEITNPNKPGKPQTIHPPKTGDESQIGVYIAVMGCAIAIILGVMVKRRKDSEYK